MITVKVSHPLNWLKHGHWPFQNHFPALMPSWGEYRFEINTAARECDIWVIHESVDRRETIKCPAGNVILVTSEEKQQVTAYPREYLDQFGMIITTRDDIIHPGVVRTMYLSPWRVRKTYDEIVNSTPRKTAMLSAVISNNVSTSGHLKRYAFVNKLKGHFKDDMAWFGKGEFEIQDKWEALEGFKYSLALENCSVPFYFTEKIMDCFCATTMPVYWGCPDIYNYFPESSMILVDIDDYKGAISKIEQAIEEGAYEKNYEALLESKKRVLNKYQFIPALVSVLESHKSMFGNNKVAQKIESREVFVKRSLTKSVLRSLKKSIGG
jgi:hypothetical protein